jgi:hypothetical protein
VLSRSVLSVKGLRTGSRHCLEQHCGFASATHCYLSAYAHQTAATCAAQPATFTTKPSNAASRPTITTVSCLPARQTTRSPDSAIGWRACQTTALLPEPCVVDF